MIRRAILRKNIRHVKAKDQVRTRKSSSSDKVRGRSTCTVSNDDRSWRLSIVLPKLEIEALRARFEHAHLGHIYIDTKRGRYEVIVADVFVSWRGLRQIGKFATSRGQGPSSHSRFTEICDSTDDQRPDSPIGN